MTSRVVLFVLLFAGSVSAQLDNQSTVPTSGPSELEIVVDRATGAERADGVPVSPLVGVAELNIPSKAKREFDKASILIGTQDFGKAIQRLNRAIAIYPAYSAAFNNLAVIYSRLDDRAREIEALQQAVSINGHFATAYLNLGRVHSAAGNFPEAEAALDKASSLDPNDTTTMVLLAYAEFMNRHLDEAIATGHRAHSLAQGQHAFVHQVAARAFELKHDAANAIAELELFLREQQTGAQAEIARKELAGLQNRTLVTPKN